MPEGKPGACQRREGAKRATLAAGKLSANQGLSRLFRRLTLSSASYVGARARARARAPPDACYAMWRWLEREPERVGFCVCWATALFGVS